MNTIANSIFKTFFLSLCVIANSHFAFAQSASILPPAKTQLFDNNGNPLVSGKVDYYVPGTTTRKTTWQDSGQTIANTNPVTLDGSGRALMLGDGSYRQVVKDRLGNLIWDAVTSSTGTGGGGSSATVGDGQPVGSMQIWAGMTAPAAYAFAYGQEFARSSFPELFAALTSQQNVSCTLGNASLTGIGNTQNIPIGSPIESTCLNSGATVVSKTISSVVASTNAIITANSSARFFPYGNGDGTSTFNAPDMRGKVPVGRCNMGGIDCSNLSATYYGVNPSALGANGGSQSKTLLTTNLPPHNHSFSGTTGTENVTHTHPNSQPASKTGLTTSNTGGAAWLNDAGGSTGAASNPHTHTFGGTTDNGAGLNSTPISAIQPGLTTNYVVKITPDTNPNSFFGVASVGGMTGVLLCGQGVTCAGNTISAISPALAPPTLAALGGIFLSSAPANQFVTGVNSTGDLTYAGASTTVNGQSCAIGGSCTISASAGTITVGTTGIVSGTSNGIMFNNAGLLGNAATANNGVVITNGSGVPSVGTTNIITNTHLAQAGAATFKGNPTAGLANEQDFTIQGLSARGVPDAANDKIPLFDNATGSIKYVTPGQIASAGVAGVASYNNLTGIVSANISDRTVFVSVSGNDGNNGLSLESSKLTMQAAIDAAYPNGTVQAGSGTWTLASPLLMQAGVHLKGSPGTIITQANAANLTNLVRFDTNSANGAAITGVTFDGNRTNNTDNDVLSFIFIGSASSVRLEYNKFYNMPGSAVVVTTGAYPIVRFNDFQNIMTLAVASTGTAISPVNTQGKFNSNNFSNQLGQHVIYIANSNGNEIFDNEIDATQLVGVANVSGHTVTWVSGANFSGFKAGGFFISAPSGSFTEGYIQVVNSATVLTIRETFTATSIPFIAGTGDIINIGNSQRNKVSRNRITGGSSGGVVIHNFYGGQSQFQTTIENNNLYFIGGTGISAQSTLTAPATTVSDTIIEGNRLWSAGVGQTAITSVGTNAVSAIDFSPTTLGSLTILNNRFQNISGAVYSQYGIYLSGVTAGQVFAGNNTNINIPNSGIRNGITSVSLGSGWGSTAVVSDVISTGGSFSFTITPNGSGIAFGPLATVNTTATTLTQPPKMSYRSYDVNGTNQPISGDLPAQNPTSTAMLVSLRITPVAGTAYYFGATGN